MLVWRDSVRVSPSISYEQICLLSSLQLILCIVTFPILHLISVCLNCWLVLIAVVLPSDPGVAGSAEDALGSSAALPQHSASIPTDGNWANPSELWGSHWLFTYFLSSAVTSVYIPLLMFNWEQKCILNFLHSDFAYSILMWFAVNLHGLFSGFVVSTGIHHFYSLNCDSLSFFLSFHPVFIRMLLSVGYSLLLMLT